MVDVEEFVERICLLAGGPGTRRFPRKRRDRSILMKSICMRLDSGRDYAEAEINAALIAWQQEVAPAIETDHVTLRRFLVDYGHLERTPDGRWYRLGFPASPMLFDLEIEQIDLPSTIAAYRSELLRKRARRGAPKADVDGDSKPDRAASD